MDERFNLEEKSRRAEKLRKDLSRNKTEGGVFSYDTLSAIGKLGSEGWIDRIIGPVSTGKEADVFLGDRKGKKTIIKIFRLSSASYFRKPAFLQYILGDERFKKVKRAPKDMIKSWCLKEFRNLKKVGEMGLPAPTPFAIEKNVIVMQYIGEEHPSPPLLKYGLDDAKGMLDEILAGMKKMYKNDFVHADLSEYNILVHKGKPVFIDFGQGVLKTHPNAEEFLERDLQNILHYFEKNYGIKKNQDKTLKYIRNGPVRKGSKG